MNISLRVKSNVHYLNILAAGLLNLFTVPAIAGTCHLSPAAQEHASAINQFIESKSESLWQSYPKGFLFGFADFDTDGKVYFVGNSDLENTGYEKCDDRPFVFRSQNSLAMDLAGDGRVWYCGPNSTSCDVLGPISSTAQTLNMPVMVERISKVQMGINESTFPTLEKYFSQSDVAAYLSAHEMFHIYQMAHFEKFHHEFQGLATTDQCSKNIESWASKLDREKAVLLEYLKVGYQPSKLDTKIFLQRLERTRKAHTDDEKRCREILERDERIEGTAHYIGNLFLEKYKSKVDSQLSAVDRIFLSGDGATVNWLHAYVSGNLIMRALNVLDPSRSWEKQIESGRSPLEVAQRLQEGKK